LIRGSVSLADDGREIELLGSRHGVIIGQNEIVNDKSKRSRKWGKPSQLTG
jgi:hypothetical protein